MFSKLLVRLWSLRLFVAILLAMAAILFSASGCGGSAAISVTPESLKFSGSAGDKKAVVIKNTGSATWGIFTWELTSPWLAIDPANKCFIKTYKAGESCTLELELTKAGSYTGAFTVNTDPGPNDTVTLES